MGKLGGPGFLAAQYLPGAMSVSKVYIGNLAEDARDRDIEKLFKGYGRVRNIVVKHEGGYGFAEFDDREDAKDAVKDLDGSSFMGSRLRIEHARDQPSEYRLTIYRYAIIASFSKYR